MKREQKKSTLRALSDEKLKEALGGTDNPTPPENPDARAEVIEIG